MVVKRLDHARQMLVASPDLLARQGTPKARWKTWPDGQHCHVGARWRSTWN
jgi:hypothetical protein